MADNTNDGLIVDVGVDASGLKPGLTAAQNEVKQYVAQTNAALATTQQAMDGAAKAAEGVAKGAKATGDALRESGSRQELNKSLNILAQAANGSTSAVGLLKNSLMAYGTALGGPVLLAISLAIAVFAGLYSAISRASEAQKQLNRDAEALHLPADELKTYTTAMRDLATQIVAVQLGFGNFSEAQLNIFKAYGIDPKSAEDAKKILVAISNSARDEQDKIRQYAIATGSSFEDAKKKWEEFHKDLDRQADGFWTRFFKYQAMGAYAQGGHFEEAVRISEEAGQTVGERAGISPFVGPVQTDAERLQTQDQIDQRNKFNDQMFDLRKAAAAAHVAVMQDEVQKILAQAKLETDGLLAEKERQLRELTDPSQREQLGSAYDERIAATNAAAEERARQVAHRAALDEEKNFRAQMLSIAKASDDATAALSEREGDRIRNDAKQRVEALRQSLNNYFSSPEFEKLNAVTQGERRTALQGQFDTAAGNITASAEARAEKADREQRLQQEQEFQDALYDYVKAGEDARISVTMDSAERIRLIGEQRVDALKRQYDRDLDNLQKNVTNKDELIRKQQQLEAARDEAIAETRAAAAKKAMDENRKPLLDLMENWSNSTKNINSLWANSLSSMADGLAKFATGAKVDWNSMVKDIVAGLIKIQIQKMLAGIFGNIGIGAAGGAIGGVGAGGGIIPTGGAMFAAGGGNVDGPTWVGERGPEIFDPAMGRIVPNSAATMGGAPNVNVNVINNGTPQTVESTNVTQSPNGLIVDVVVNDLQKGGRSARALQDLYGVRRKS